MPSQDSFFSRLMLRQLSRSPQLALSFARCPFFLLSSSRPPTRTEEHTLSKDASAGKRMARAGGASVAKFSETEKGSRAKKIECERNEVFTSRFLCLLSERRKEEERGKEKPEKPKANKQSHGQAPRGPLVLRRRRRAAPWLASAASCEARQAVQAQVGGAGGERGKRRSIGGMSTTARHRRRLESIPALRGALPSPLSLPSKSPNDAMNVAATRLRT